MSGEKPDQILWLSDFSSSSEDDDDDVFVEVLGARPVGAVDSSSEDGDPQYYPPTTQELGFVAPLSLMETPGNPDDPMEGSRSKPVRNVQPHVEDEESHSHLSEGEGTFRLLFVVVDVAYGVRCYGLSIYRLPPPPHPPLCSFVCCTNILDIHW